ncbi:O-methyltransferase-domain-containing protein [Apiospora kogelbergensis]|uniref:O-methyltransferase-domain-containing protein n=1 Tax=Apiospora kogelbergensis TaxID=1337665 RepID=UPI0031328C92
MAAATTRIAELSSLIARETAKLDEFLRAENLPTPSLDENALESLPIPDRRPDIKEARLSVMEACSELKDLLTGPKELLRFPWTQYASVKAILRFKLDQSFEVGQSTSFEAMSEFSGLNVMNIRRIVRHGIINHHFFKEDVPGVITHSALTAILAGNESMRNSLIVEIDEFWPTAVKVADAMEKWPNSEENNETAFALANNSQKSMFDLFADEPVRGERFGRYFSQDKTADGLLDNYTWAEKASMVDVGGSHGSVAISVAERFPHMVCHVQDLRDTVAKGASRLPADLRDRVLFREHDFFNDQTVVADVYYFKSIFHNWADKYCIKILQKLVPALKKGARIVIHERILPGLESLTTVDARRAINLDVGMLQLLNAQQREMHEWPELFRRAHSGYRYLGARQPPGAIRWIIEAEWEG